MKQMRETHLSEVITISVSFHMPLSFSRAVKFPTTTPTHHQS